MQTATALLAGFALALVLSACGDKEGSMDTSGPTGPGDADGDGYDADEDCDDADAAAYPGAPELCDGVDNDCDEQVDEDATDALTFHADADGDGFGDAAASTLACEAPSGFVADDTDCDDTDADISPAATEICDDADVDEDCSGDADDADQGVDPATLTTFFTDADGDGHGDPATAADRCDAASDQVTDDTDCDDADAAVNPAATEICDDADVDEDCSGGADDADAGVDTATFATFHTDADADGYGDPRTAAQACDPASDQVTDDTDCDDTDAGVNPRETEVCDDADVDEDCSGDADDADAGVDATTHTTFYTDADADGYGDAATAADACDPAADQVTDSTDCDDTDADISPAATEICDDADVDEDCDGLADDADASVDPTTWTSFYTDADTDGYGDAGTESDQCDATATQVTDDTDCDDSDAAINPGATEICDSGDVDEDCSGLADDDDGGVDTSGFTTFYTDGDADTYGDASSAAASCDPAADQVTDDTDCDDTDAAINPAATEVCDSGDVDEDCNGLADDDDGGVDTGTFTTFYTDGDADTYGDASTGAAACDPAADQVTDDTDCDDTDASINPGATEVCDDADVDEDCDGLADDGDGSLDTSTGSTFYTDGDADGYGDPSTADGRCEATASQVTDDTDCDDSDASINPGATELPQDGIDNDCDGSDAAYAVTDLLDGDLVITEVMQNPSTVPDPDGEWFEVWNNSGGDVDLDGLYVYDESTPGVANTDFTVTGPLVFSDGEYLVLGYSDDTSINGGVTVDYAYGSAMALGNGSDELVLTDGSGTELDRVEWDDGASFPDPTGAAMALCPQAEDDNEDGIPWTTATASYGLGDLGTPGSVNTTCPTSNLGNDSEYTDTYTHGADYLVGFKISVPSDVTLDRFGIIFKGGTGSYKMALYTDNAGDPDTLVAGTSSIRFSGAGTVEPDVADVALTAGDYWIMMVNDNPASVGVTYPVGLAGEVKYRALPYTSSLPTTFGTNVRSTGLTWNYYIVVY